MSDKIKMEINSDPKYGYNLSRTSYDVRQEINAKVIGVLKYNNEIRKKLLDRNIGIYNQVNSPVIIGNISDVYSLEASKPLSLEENGLLGHTHINDNKYKKSINQKYDIGAFIQYYRHGSLPDSKFLKWRGLYNDYTQYIEEVYGIPHISFNKISDVYNTKNIKDLLSAKGIGDLFLTARSVINDFLQYDNIKYAMEKTRIGTVNPNPIAAEAGAITTNINNFNSNDTALGLMTNYLYAQTLQDGARFNTIRKTKYITPEVYTNIGNKLHTLSVISSDYRIDDETGRLAFELGGNYSTTINYDNILNWSDYISTLTIIDNEKNLADSNHARYRNLDLNVNYKPFRDYQYFIEPYDLINSSTTPTLKGRIYNIWDEGDNKNDAMYSKGILDSNSYTSYNNTSNSNGLIHKTKELFKKHDENGIDTLIGRFHTGGGRDTTHNKIGLLQTAITSFGMSHGRNLLTKNAYENKTIDKTNGYENPYCRVWTYHNQYSKISDLIRPFSETNSIKDISVLQENWWKFGRRKGSAKRLNDNTVVNKNGFVNIAPTNETPSNSSSIKKCMFSIENLAWKDITVDSNSKILSKEQTGPNGGRIMWFPPYDLKFNENVSVNWGQNEFIGRGEKIYTYTNTERSGTLSFTLLVDHPSILDMWKNNGATKEVFDDEERILRFFAGCDVLELNNIKEPLIEYETIPLKPEPEIPITDENKTKNMVFYIFFPNNYSGNDDDINIAVDYLSNNYEGKNGSDYDSTPIYPDYKWCYRVDSDLIEEKMKNPSNYCNIYNLHLNDSLESVKKNKGFEDATHSFCDICNMSFTGINVEYVYIEGFASNHGYENNNVDLSQRRCDLVKRFVQDYLDLLECNEKNCEESNDVAYVDEVDKENVSGETAKRARCAKVILTYTSVDKTLPLTNITTSEDNVSEISNNTIENSGKLTRKEKRALKKQLKQKEENKEAVNNMNNIGNFFQNEISKNIGNKITPLPNLVVSAIKVDKEKFKELLNIDDEPVRWEDEAQYFEMLQSNDTFVFSKIVDKIKYFNPAFHSITPEGFNARLGFLHQCTRQGSTYGTSDNPSLRSAGNLAFGRPPICVLRIGDFYHTKIIIDSVTIDYDNPQWDINPEGIGMQPMFAKISLNFKFLGGSDIEAPISRLQNAISFNYYANQSIYDDRADMGIYYGKTPKIQGTPWNPSIKDKNG